MSDRATFEETLEFCQEVRAAGGGSALHALMPAVPQDSTQCLVAKNLNFDCVVDCPDHVWTMRVSNLDVAQKIHEQLGLERVLVEAWDGSGEIWEDDEGYYGLALPENIAAVARDFDEAEIQMDALVETVEKYKDAYSHSEVGDSNVNDWIRDDEINITLIKEMLPYIEAAETEAYELATKINEKGEIVL